MKISYSFGADDYLAYLLYISSQSEPAKKKRFKFRIVFPVLCLFTGVYFVAVNKDSDYSIFIGFFSLAVLWFVLYPKLDYLYRKRLYNKHVKENYPNGKKESLTLEISNDWIHAKDDKNEGKVSTSKIESIDETCTMLFITLKEGDAFIIPKNEINNPDSVRKQLLELSKHLNAPYVLNE